MWTAGAWFLLVAGGRIVIVVWRFMRAHRYRMKRKGELMTWWTETWVCGGDPSWDVEGHLVVRVDEAQAVIDRLEKDNAELRLKLARLEGPEGR